MIVPELPKTRSGKIMRRLLKDVAENREVGDVTTLADSTVMDMIKSEGVRLSRHRRVGPTSNRGRPGSIGVSYGSSERLSVVTGFRRASVSGARS